MSKAKLRSFADAEAALQPYIPVVKQLTGKDTTLLRMKALMDYLGNPEQRLNVIHVAGTSGKTSTAYYIAGLLMASGNKVGLTVSPHIDVISERLQVNLQPLVEKEFCEALSEFLAIVDIVKPVLTYFELIIAMAYWYFDKIGVDYAVIETGMGGRFDASNVCDNRDKICILTDIGFDHTNILGDTLFEISMQKAGIMHEGNWAVTFEQNKIAIDTFQAYAKDVGACLDILHEKESTKTFTENTTFMTLPGFQKRNWGLAYNVYQYVTKRDRLTGLNAQQLETSMRIKIPGRMDLYELEGKQIIMDGAHNEQKMKSFVDSFRAAYPGKKVPVLVGMKNGKEYTTVLDLLLPISSRLIATSFDINQDLQSLPIEPRIIVEQARKCGFTDVVEEPDTAKAFNMLRNTPSDIAVVTGSFYLLANVRRLMLEV